MEHFTRASEVLNLSQSAVSASIATLEYRCGISLFHRVGRRVELNSAGRIFLDHANAVIARAHAAELVLADLAGLKRGTLMIQASLTVASHWLAPHLVSFRNSYPGVEVKLVIANTAQVAKCVITGEAEIGIVEGAVTDSSLILEAVGSDRLVIVTGPAHPWVNDPHLVVDRLLEGKWVVRELGSGTRSAFESALCEMGLATASLKVVQELPSNEAILSAVQSGDWVAATSDLVASPMLRAGLLRRIAFDLPQRQFFLLRHKERYRSHAADALAELLKRNGKRRLDGSA
jgi:DNA-binding transcriptional LysR family regulator